MGPREGPEDVLSGGEQPAGKEIRRRAAVQQASEYVVEHRAALLEYFKRVDVGGRGVVSFYEWARGLAQVLQVRLAWQKLVSGLVAPGGHGPRVRRGGVRAVAGEIHRRAQGRV